MNFFDIGILIIVVICLLVGVRKGFIKSFASLFGWLLTISLTILLAQTVATYLLNVPAISKFFFGNEGGFSFAKWFYSILPKSLRIDMDTVRGWVVADGTVASNAGSILIDKIKDKNAFVGGLFALFGGSLFAPLSTPELLSYNFGNLAQAMSILLSHALLVLLAGILLFVALRIVFGLMTAIIRKLTIGVSENISLPSRIIGGILGAAKGLVVCIFIFLALSSVLHLGFMSGVRKELFNDKSIIAEDFAEAVFDETERRLEPEQLDKAYKMSGYTNSVDLSTFVPPPAPEPDEQEPAETEPDEQEPAPTE